jgi:hypothetical protein
VPADCTDARAVAMPRLTVSEIASTVVPPPDLTPPRSADLRGHLRAAQTALDRGDRASFSAAVAEARSLLATHPPGAERDAAVDALRIYDDVARVWTFQQEDAAGAFFDESSDLYRSASAYPGYSDAVRRQVLVVGGRRYYPSTETRRFLGRAASERLARLGVRTPAPRAASRAVAEQPRAVAAAPPPVRRRKEPVVASMLPGASAGSRSTSGRSSTSERRSSSSERRTSPAARHSSTAAPPRPVASAPARASAAPARVTPVPAPVASTPTPIIDESPTATATTADPLAPTATTTTATDAFPATGQPGEPATQTTATATARPRTPETTPATAPTEKRTGILLPAIVILVAIGFLVLLFRASD